MVGVNGIVGSDYNRKYKIKINAPPQAKGEAKKSHPEGRKTLLQGREKRARAFEGRQEGSEATSINRLHSSPAPKVLSPSRRVGTLLQKNDAASIVPPYSAKSIRVSSVASAKRLTTDLVWWKAWPQALPNFSTRSLKASILSKRVEILDVILRRYCKINSVSRFSICLLLKLLFVS